MGVLADFLRLNSDYIHCLAFMWFSHESVPRWMPALLLGIARPKGRAARRGAGSWEIHQKHL